MSEFSTIPARALVRRVLGQALPILIAQWASIAYGVVDTVLVGHASARDLAAMALGASIYGSVFIGLLGFVNVLNPIIAQHFGAGRHAEIGRTVVQGVWIAVWLTLIGDVALCLPDAWLSMSEVSPDVRDLVARYLQAVAFALPAALLFRTCYALHTAISRPKVIMALNLVGLAVKIPLTYVLIYGRLGLPALGAVGCGVATAVVMWLLCIAAGVLIASSGAYREFAIRFAWPEWKAQKELLRLGIPMGLSFFVEVTAFTFMALLVARIGTTTVGAHQIIANLAASCYMVPLSLSIAFSTLTAQAIGAGDPVAARRIALLGLRLTLAFAATFSLTIWILRGPITGLYTSDAAVAAIALSLVPYLVVFHVCDAMQTAASFVLRAYKRALGPMLIYTVTLWGIGLVGGYWIAFSPVFGRLLGVYGIWGAATLSLFIAAVALVAYMLAVSRGAISENRAGASFA